MKNTWSVDEWSAGQRLDVFLAEQIPDLTRSALAKKIKNGEFFIDGKKTAVHTFLKAGQKINHRPRTDSPEQQAEKQTRSPRYLPKLEKMIVQQTKDWILINKPAGLLVHPDAKHAYGTLVDILLKKYPSMAKIGEDPQRPGIVHRLDRDVSGLMVVAKTQKAFDDLKQQFAQRKTQKSYIALVHGRPPKEQGEIKFKIARSKSKPRMAARPSHEAEGQVAWTHYKVIKTLKRYSLVELDIFSGRTHQIRAHLFAIGCPVVGDTLYTANNPKKNSLKSKDRIMLQSFKLSFTDPATQETLHFSIEPDQEFNDLVNKITK